MAKQATIKDVAQIAGVSTATVSRALNDPSYPVSQETKQRIQAAITQTNYIPNAAARSLRSDTSTDIGLLIPNLSNPFYLQTTIGITEVLSKHRYNLVFCNTMRNAKLEQQYLQQLYARNIRGVILSSVDDNGDTIRKFSQRGMQFVLLDQKLAGLDCAGIHFDVRAGARMAVEHLTGLGHRRIAFATMPMSRWSRMEMHSGYAEALAATGLRYDPALVYEAIPQDIPSPGKYELDAGRSIAARLIADGCPATAVICINDMMAIGLLKGLLEHHIRIPEDVSVFGCDDIPLAAAFSPALSTVCFHTVEAGRLAAMMLLENIGTEKSEMQLAMQLSPTLVIRDTVGPPRTHELHPGAV